MAYTPLMNQAYVEQSFSQVISGPNLLGIYIVETREIATATDGFVYYPGAVLAVYTSGGSEGQVVNWVEGGSAGQGQAYAVLIENYLNPLLSSAMPAGTFVKVLRIGNVSGAPLSITSGSTLNTALGQLGATPFQQPDLSTAYNIRGTVVS
jgi:hypothetical protein